MNATAKNLFVVVHHQQDSSQPWPNSWLDDDWLEAITATNEIARLCEDTKEKHKPIFVHRCACGDSHPSVCCSGFVGEVAHIDRHTSLVKFADQKTLNIPPPVSPHLGQNFYWA